MNLQQHIELTAKVCRAAAQTRMDEDLQIEPEDFYLALQAFAINIIQDEDVTKEMEE